MPMLTVGSLVGAHQRTRLDVLAREDALACRERNDEILAMGQDEAKRSRRSAVVGLGRVQHVLAHGRRRRCCRHRGNVRSAVSRAAGLVHRLLLDVVRGRPYRDKAHAVVDAQNLRFDTVEDSSLPLCGTHQLAATAWELDEHAEMAANLIPFSRSTSATGRTTSSCRSAPSVGVSGPRCRCWVSSTAPCRWSRMR